MTQTVLASNRVLLTGRTGSGKTYAANVLCSGLSRLVVIDTKGTLTGWNCRDANPRLINKLEHDEPVRIRLVPDIVDNQTEWFEQLFERLYHIGNLTVYIDEVYGVLPPGQRPGKWFNALYTRGREFGIGVWAATQRPAWVPLVVLSEADWFLVFRLHMTEDRRRMAGVIGEQALIAPPDPHGFWLYNSEWIKPVYYRSIKST